METPIVKWWFSMVEVVYTAARGEPMSIMNLLLNPLWSRSWQMAPTHKPRHYNLCSRMCYVQKPDLQRSEYSWRSLKDAVDAVADMEPMSPVVVSNSAVVSFNCHKEPHLQMITLSTSISCVLFYQSVKWVSFKTKQVNKHEDRFLDFLHVTQASSIVKVAKMNNLKC